ncbi:ketoacyl-synt-domain-containing protein [Rhodofomes roseus]|uniref:Ketoacyl-synt-domain-containing protein n=1 Tax=Rhodofomes roseus TaxID=34475 RepID=A0ABQ8KRA6_9APHY|nr:ketoacyl-synt-domain-containing protein [Rhodofomes roseus]KAH9840927.1 ketoacyl-synt-domain-containing protein [Rhodofomes roseus]
MSPPELCPIAIVGIAAELPSGAFSSVNLDHKAFFEFLLAGGEAYEKIPIDRFNIHAIKGNGVGQIVTDTGAFLKDISLFDHVEFGITSKDARLMPLGTRKLIETTFLALLDSGIDYRGGNVGCYMSGTAQDVFSVSGHDDAEVRGSFAFSPSMVANRVSYHLDLRGPSLPLDTACSSSLYATHLAVQALRNGECEAAVVGGAQLNHRFSEWMLYTQGGVLSRDGKCKPFDASADGFGRGEGVVSIVLKPLEAALRDNDRIYANILGTGVNSSGSLAPVNAPVASAQRDAMIRAFRMAGRSPKEVDFIELHATGTATGDPTEANWVGAEFQRDDELVIGSVKGNIGHLEITAFLASLSKVCSILETRQVPPTVNFKNSNQKIRWTEYGFRVPVETEVLRCRAESGSPLIAMTSSGIGGANGHVVVEGAPSLTEIPSTFWCGDAIALLISAGLSPRSVAALNESLNQLDGKYVDYSAVSRALGRRARSMTWRSYAVVANGCVSRFSEPVLAPKGISPIVFVLSGQGPQHWNMGRDLYESCAVFRTTINELDQVYLSTTGQSLVSDIGLFANSFIGSDSLGAVWPIAITLPSLTMLQLALIDTLAALGIKPNAVVGHSAGEVALLYASGAGSKALALELAIARGKAMSLLEKEDGTMAALACSPKEAELIVAQVAAEFGDGVLEIGCYNSPDAVTLSGATGHIEKAVEKAKKAGVFATKLRTRIPVHSGMMELCAEDYKRRVGEIFPNYKVTKPTVETYSTLTGAPWDEAFSAEYFWDNTRGPVQFTSAMQALLKCQANATFIELGPHPVLASYISAMAGSNALVTCPVRRPKSSENPQGVEVQTFMDSIGKLVAAGHTVDFDALCGVVGQKGEVIPPFPFARKEVPYHAQTFEVTRQHQHRNGPLNYPQLRINTKTHPELAEHVIKEEPIMPAAGYLEMALEFGAKRLWDVEFMSILSLSSEKPTPVDIKLDGSKWSVHSASASEFTKTWPPNYNRIHAKGRLSMTNDSEPLSLVDVAEIRSRMKPIEMRAFYDGFSFAQYGATYQRIVSSGRGYDKQGREEILVEVRGADSDLGDISNYILHPAILDSALHILVHPAITGNRDKGRYYLPAKIGTFAVHAPLLKKPFPSKVFTHATFVKWTPESLIYDFEVVTEAGEQLCTITDLEVALHGKTAMDIDTRYELALAPTDLRVARLDGIASRRRESSSPISDASSDSGYATIETEKSTPADANTRVVEYARGREMELQRFFAEVDPLAPLSLWFIATEGLNGDASLGFTRSIRREYRSWKVRDVVFDSSWSSEERQAALRQLAADPNCEEELSIDADGHVFAPRIVGSAPPTDQAPFEAGQPWVYEKSRSILKQISTPHVPEDHVLVNVTGIAQRYGDAWSFIGRAAGMKRPVAGITFGELSNVVVAHVGSLVEIVAQDDLAPHIFADVLAVLAVGPATFVQPSRLRNSTIVVTHADSSLGSEIAAIYGRLGLHVLKLTSTATLSDVRHVASQNPKVIVSGSDGSVENALLNELLHRSDYGAFVWDDSRHGLKRHLDNNPWSVGDALRCAMETQPGVSGPVHKPLELVGTRPTEEVPLATDLFDEKKTYLLIGGIGSLGLQIALWMYEQGARSIIITSRSGRESLTRKAEFISLRLLAYLESLPDLALRVESVDATSSVAMRALLSNLDHPLGGCMILSAAMVDRTFAMQTHESFEVSVAAKVGVFQVLEKLLDGKEGIEKLEFVVATSSVCGLFGNAGQTNYACANTGLTGLVGKYNNGCTIVAPFILDTGLHVSISTTDIVYWTRFKHLHSWGMTGWELCEHIGDAIKKIRSGPTIRAAQYIPAFDWAAVQSNLGHSPLYDALVPESESEGAQEDSADVSIAAIVCRVLDIVPGDLNAEVPLTSYGLDSLSAASLSHALRDAVAVSQIQLLADLTVVDLEKRREEALENGAGEQASSGQEQMGPKEKEMLAMLERYGKDLPLREPANEEIEMKKVVLVTGTTGSVGAHLLVHLLQGTQFDKVYILVRKGAYGQTAKARQKTALEARGLDVAVVEMDRLGVLEGDLLAYQLGLGAEVYAELAQTVTHVIHLAWPIDFGTPLANFESAIAGLRKLLDFSMASRSQSRMRLLFASTAGIFRRIASKDPVPEELVDNPSVAVGTGYSESKWIAEQMLQRAAESNICQPSIVRLGQLSGGANGAWRTTEWIPSMVTASLALGCLPDGSGDATWIPVDASAAAMLDFVDTPARVLHIQHPRPVSWTSVMQHFSSALNLPLAPYAEWFARLESGLSFTSDPSSTQYLERGLRLLDILRLPLVADPGNPRPDVMNALVHGMDLKNALEASATLKDPGLPGIVREDVDRWIAYWHSVGYLPK